MRGVMGEWSEAALTMETDADSAPRPEGFEGLKCGRH